MGNFDVQSDSTTGPMDLMQNAITKSEGPNFEEKPISGIGNNRLDSSSNSNTRDTSLEERIIGSEDILNMIFRHIEQVYREVLTLGKKVEKTNARIHNLRKIIEAKMR
jgi:hypothetical protein